MTAATAIAENRLAKALRIAETLVQAGASAYRVTQMEECHWRLACAASQVHLASPETRLLVQQLIEAREKPRRRKV